MTTPTDIGDACRHVVGVEAVGLGVDVGVGHLEAGAACGHGAVAPGVGGAEHGRPALGHEGPEGNLERVGAVADRHDVGDVEEGSELRGEGGGSRPSEEPARVHDGRHLGEQLVAVVRHGSGEVVHRDPVHETSWCVGAIRRLTVTAGRTPPRLSIHTASLCVTLRSSAQQRLRTGTHVRATDQPEHVVRDPAVAASRGDLRCAADLRLRAVQLQRVRGRAALLERLPLRHDADLERSGTLGHGADRLAPPLDQRSRGAAGAGSAHHHRSTVVARAARARSRRVGVRVRDLPGGLAPSPGVPLQLQHQLAGPGLGVRGLHRGLRLGAASRHSSLSPGRSRSVPSPSVSTRASPSSSSPCSSPSSGAPRPGALALRTAGATFACGSSLVRAEQARDDQRPRGRERLRRHHPRPRRHRRRPGRASRGGGLPNGRHPARAMALLRLHQPVAGRRAHRPLRSPLRGSCVVAAQTSARTLLPGPARARPDPARRRLLDQGALPALHGVPPDDLRHRVRPRAAGDPSAPHRACEVGSPSASECSPWPATRPWPTVPTSPGRWSPTTR